MIRVLRDPAGVKGDDLARYEELNHGHRSRARRSGGEERRTVLTLDILG